MNKTQTLILIYLRGSDCSKGLLSAIISKVGSAYETWLKKDNGLGILLTDQSVGMHFHVRKNNL